MDKELSKGQKILEIGYGLVTIAFILFVVFFIGMKYEARTHIDGCWDDLNSVEFEADFQKERKRLLEKFDKNIPLTSDEAEHWFKMYKDETMYSCVKMYPYEKYPDLEVYRKKTKYDFY